MNYQQTTPTNQITDNPFKILWHALKTLWSRSHFSWINLVNIINIAIVTFIPQLYSSGLITAGYSFLATTILTVILQLITKHKELVQTGLNLDPVFYLVAFIGIVISGVDQLVASGFLIELMGPKLYQWFVIIYSVVLMFLRTGYTAQSTGSVIQRKRR